MSEHSAKPSVFISYSRTDRPQITLLAVALEARGCSVWWDKMIEGGSAFAKLIEEKLDSCDAVVAVWSKASIESDWVRDEAGHGRDRKRLLPVSLDGTESPLGFRQYHAINLSQWRGDPAASQIDEVMRGVTALGDPRAAGARAPDAAHNGAKFSRRTTLALAGGATVAAAGGLAWWQGLFGKDLVNSIAVMPFKNLSGDPGQTYFSDGLSEEIRTTLSRNPRLQIAAPTSVAEFRNQPDDSRKIGEKLGVAFLLAGSFRRSGNLARISAELIETENGFNRWAQTFDRQITDIFAVQSEIANVVAEALALRVVALKQTRGGTKNVAAYEAYLRGLNLLHAEQGEETDRGALAEFSNALVLDAGFSIARAERSRTLTAIANNYATADQLEGMYADAISEAQRAVKEAPDAPQTQFALAFVTAYGKRDMAAARPVYERAYELGGGDANIAIAYAVFCSHFGLEEAAIATVNKVLKLDPLNPLAFRTAGLTQYYARNYGEAAAQFRKALALRPDIRNAHGYLGHMALLQGQLAEARKEYAVEKQDLIRLPGLAILERKHGNNAVAQTALDSLMAKLGDSGAYQQVQVFAQWGELERAFTALDRAVAVRDSGLLLSKVDPLLDPLRGDARFSRLLSAMGLG